MAEFEPYSVRTYSCNTWDDFIKEIRRIEVPGARIFRGQRDPTWKLSSAWERILSQRKNQFSFGREYSFDITRQEYLKRFQELSIGLPGFQSRNLSEDEWWALGRHYGLITPLLDWTQSPYVAAFFACFDYADYCNPGFKNGLISLADIRFTPGKIAVWELLNHDEIKPQNEFEIISSSRIDFSHRQNAQQGLFTRLTHSTHLDVEAFLISKGLGYCLGKYEIPGEAVGQALGDLHLMNINPATLFPDLVGAAEMANLRHTLNIVGIEFRE